MHFRSHLEFNVTLTATAKVTKKDWWLIHVIVMFQRFCCDIKYISSIVLLETQEAFTHVSYTYSPKEATYRVSVKHDSDHSPGEIVRIWTRNQKQKISQEPQEEVQGCWKLQSGRALSCCQSRQWSVKEIRGHSGIKWGRLKLKNKQTTGGRQATKLVQKGMTKIQSLRADGLKTQVKVSR